MKTPTYDTLVTVSVIHLVSAITRLAHRRSRDKTAADRRATPAAKTAHPTGRAAAPTRNRGTSTAR